METMLISEFKTHAIATLKRVQKTGQPILVTIRGKSVAEILPPPEEQALGVRLGTGKGLMRKRPTARELIEQDFSEEWEAGQ
jgi:antitoxin (DNA-binding transcriptional repressor) of toxin-antitoxin stability system